MIVNLNYTWNASKPDVDDLQYCEKTYCASFCDGRVTLRPRLVTFTTWSKPPGGYTMYLFWGDTLPVWCVLMHIFADYMCKLYSVWLLTRSTSVHTWLVNSSFSWLTVFCVPQDLRGGAHADVAMQNQYQNRVENVKLVWKSLFASMTGHKQVGFYHTSKFSDGL